MNQESDRAKAIVDRVAAEELGPLRVEETPVKQPPVPKPVKRSYHSVKMGLGLWNVIALICVVDSWLHNWAVPNKVWIGGMIAIVIFNFVLYFRDRTDGPKGY